jgi:hypothetical protein
MEYRTPRLQADGIPTFGKVVGDYAVLADISEGDD